MRRTGAFFLILWITAAPLAAVDTAFWQVGSFEEFLQGTLRNVSLSKDGHLRVAPETRAIFNPEETLALSLATDKGGNIFIGTGHQGKVFRVDAHGKGSLFFTADESEIFALAAADDGTLYVGSSPEGKIYRVSADGKSTVFYDPEAKYIWALKLDAKGDLYAGTGDQGKIFKIDPSGKGEVFFDSRQTHIMCLTFDHDGNLLAGSVPNGLVYRINPAAQAFVLLQADHPEIHDLAVDTRGQIYAAALGGARGKAAPSLLLSPQPTTPPSGGVTTVTVTASTAEEGSDELDEAQTQSPDREQGGTNARRSAPRPTASIQQPPQGRGSLILIRPDQTVETVWSSNNESIFGLAVQGDRVLFSTDADGRIFDLNARRVGEKLTLLTETRESVASRLLLQGSDLYIATSNIAKVFRIGGSLATEGSYESDVKDTKFVSKWGNLAWRADVPPGSFLEFYTRSGNSDRPDRTWTDWAGPYRKSDGSPIQSLPARFIQWKAVFRTTADRSPDLSEVTIAYLNQNLPPEVRSLTVSSAGESPRPSRPPMGSAAGRISITATPSSGGSSPSPSSPAPTVLRWQGEDPNRDELRYAVYVQATDEQEWHLVEDNIRQTNYTIEANSLPDGKYIARVVASDEESNPPDVSRTGELISTPFWVDNTPPTVTVVRTQIGKDGVQVQFHVQDTTSPLRHAETALDAKEWRDIGSDDGIVDANQESFTVRLKDLEGGEHVLILRAFDTAGNVGIGKAIIRFAAGAGSSP